MARILLIQNLHPTEANAIGISRMVAKILKKQGHEIFIRKFKPGETVYGLIYRHGKGEKIPNGRLKLHNISGTGSADYKQRVSQWMEETSPDMAFDFHCTPYERLRKVVFDKGELPKINAVDIPAIYKGLPEKVQQIIDIGSNKISASAYYEKYITRTTSWQASKKIKELNPERMAKDIVRGINERIRIMSHRVRAAQPKVPLVKMMWKQAIKRIGFRK